MEWHWVILAVPVVWATLYALAKAAGGIRDEDD